LALSATVALIILPLIAIPVFGVVWSLGNALERPDDPFGLGVLLGLGIPCLASIAVTRWVGGVHWVVAILFGIASGGIAAFVLFVGYLVGCRATDCGS
jgi:hypothetical protein